MTEITPPLSPKMSSNATAATSSVLSAAAPNVSGSTGNDPPLSSATTGITDPGTLFVNCSAFDEALQSTANGKVYNFRDHPRVKQLLSLFSIVEITQVRAFVFQSTVFSSSASGTKTALVRFGCIPRSLPLAVQNGGVVGFIPCLESLSTSTNVASTARVIWGAGGLPFPPGLQLDLRAVETRHNYINFLLANATKLSDSFEVARAQLDFTVRCSGQNFGSVF